MTVALFEIANIREALDAVIAENDGVLDEQLEAALAQVDGDFEEKAERCGLWVREQLATAEAIKAEEERLAAKRTAAVNRAKRVTEYLFAQMKRVGKQRVNGLLCQLVIAKNPPSVVETVPASQADLATLWHGARGSEFITRKEPVYSWDKAALKDAIKAGTVPEHITTRVRLVTDNTRLDIK